MKLKLISKQLFKNYFLMLVILLTLLLSTFLLYLVYNNSQLNKDVFDYDQFILDYDQGFNKALANQALEKDDYLLVFDLNYTLLDAYNYDSELGKQYDYFSFDEISDNDDAYSYYIFEDEYSEYIVLLYLAPLTPNVLFIIIIIVIATLTFILMTIYLAKRTGKEIILPLERLSKGVKAIASGDYDHIIQFETSNELDHIRDDINHMSLQLKNEIRKRKQLENQRNQLILSLSHDIKTPLTNVIGYSQLLMGQSIEDESIRHSVEIIHKYGLNAAELTDELFDFTKLNMDQHNMITEEVDLVEVVRIKLIEYINEFESLNIKYSFNLPNESIRTNLNILKFYRVLDNLIQNSIKYNHKDFDLQITIESTSRTINLILEDNGIGIPISYHSTIFDPMVRVENSRNRKLGGTGLGLSIAKQIMNNHGGDITIDSSYDKGCRFIMTLPK